MKSKSWSEQDRNYNHIRSRDTTESKNCLENVPPVNKITHLLTLGLLALLILLEFLHFVSKERVDPWRFIEAIPIVKFFMSGFTLALLILQWHDGKMKSKSWSEQDRNYNHSAQNHLLKWALFLAWLNLILSLGKIDFFGRHIYIFCQIMRSTFLLIEVVIPSLTAFMFGFHCLFMKIDGFQVPTFSWLESFGIFLEVNFLYDILRENEESNHSLKISSIYILVFMSVIMNLILVAIIFDKMDTSEVDAILAKQRIKEISRLSKFTSWISQSSDGKHGANVVCITAAPKKERNGFLGKSGQLGKKWKLKAHSNSICRDIDRLNTFYPDRSIIKQTEELLNNKEKMKAKQMKEVKKIQAETQEKLNELIELADVQPDKISHSRISALVKGLLANSSGGNSSKMVESEERSSFLETDKIVTMILQDFIEKKTAL